jgi:hypothetical protein
MSNDEEMTNPGIRNPELRGAQAASLQVSAACRPGNSCVVSELRVQKNLPRLEKGDQLLAHPHRYRRVAQAGKTLMLSARSFTVRFLKRSED